MNVNLPWLVGKSPWRQASRLTQRAGILPPGLNRRSFEGINRILQFAVRQGGAFSRRAGGHGSTAGETPATTGHAKELFFASTSLKSPAPTRYDPAFPTEK